MLAHTPEELEAIRDMVLDELNRSSFSPIDASDKMLPPNIINYVLKRKHFSPKILRSIEVGELDWWHGGIARTVVEALNALSDELSVPSQERVQMLHALCVRHYRLDV